MNKNEILELLFQKYKKLPQNETCNNFLVELIVTKNDKNPNIDIEKEFKDFINTVAFDNFYKGFSVAINIMML
ncbi:MAG: hypothetical protein LIO71_05085 [Ruminococcus sp.]|nr:hypothetical protein [Ruminococcus sp.]